MDQGADRLSPEGLLSDSRWLRALAKGLVGDVGADDLVQETWLSVLRRPPRFLTNLRPWLRTVARNLSLRDRHRQHERRQREARAARVEGQPATDDLVARATLRRSVVDAVLGLDEPYRSTILLRFFEELPPREVARRQSVPVATVRTRLSRGLAQLRTRLDGDHGGQRAWIALLVPARGLFGVWWLTGAIVMGTKLKVACAAIALILGALGFWQWSRYRAPGGDSGGLAAGPVLHEAFGPASKPATAVAGATDAPAIRPKPYREEVAKEFGITGIAIDDRTDQPVLGIVARLLRHTWSDEPESVPSEGTTDREGRFRIPVPEKVRVRGLTLLSPEYAPLVVDHLDNDVRKATGDALDVGTLRLQRGARVSGRVISAETGEPIPGAQLFVSPRGYPTTQPLLADARPVGRSGSDGTFVLPERVAPNVNQLLMSAAILSAVTDDGVGWAFLSIVEDREALEGVEVSIARGASVRVTVVDEADKPIEGALVTAAPRFPPIGPPDYFGREYSGGWVQDAVRGHFSRKAGRDGLVALRGLPIGRNDQRFSQYPGSPSAYDINAMHADFVRSEPQRVEFDPAKETTLQIKLVRRRLCVLHGRITTQSGDPIEGVRVEDRGVTAVATTDREGAYRLEGRDTSDGRIYLELRAPGYAKRMPIVALSTSADDLVADFVLLKAAPIGGRVIDQDGHPVPGAYVDILDGSTGPDRRQYRPDGTGDLDAEGRFIFSDATAGRWTLRAHPPAPADDWVPDRDRIVQGGDRSVEVVLRRREPGRARLEAEIVDALTGLPVDPAEVSVRRAARSFAGDTGFIIKLQTSIGRVTGDKLRPGAWTLSVRLSDGSRASREFTVLPEDTIVRVRLEVGKPGAIVVKVDLGAIAKDARPSRLAVFTFPYDAVQWMTKPGQIAPNCTRGFGAADASNDWTIRFEDVTPNIPIRFWTMSEGSVYAECEVTVGPGEEKQIVLRPVAAASVTFRKPKSAPVAGVTISIKRPDGTWSEVCSDTWEEGEDWKRQCQVAAGHLTWRAERYPLEVDPEERRVAAVVEGELDLAPGNSREIPIVFPK